MARDLGTAKLPSDAACQDRAALIFGVKNPDDTVKKLQEQGVHFITKPTNYPDYGIRSVHLRDPDGNLIEIYSQLPKGRWSEELREEDKLFPKK